MPPKPDSATGELPPALLQAHRELSTELLAKFLQPFISELGENLLQLSSDDRGLDEASSLGYDAAIALQLSGDIVVRDITSAVDALYEELLPDGDKSDADEAGGMGVEELNLVDISEFEAALAINRIVTRAEEKFSVPMEALTIRIATLADAPPLRLRLPVHVRQLCRVLQQILLEIQVPREYSIKMVEMFTRNCAADLDDFYQALNKHLSESGVRPQLEREIASKGSLLRKAKERGPGLEMHAAQSPEPGQTAAEDEIEARDDGAGDARAFAAAQRNQGGAQIPMHSEPISEQHNEYREEQLFQSVINTLHHKRSGESPDATGVPPAPASPEQAPTANWPSTPDNLADITQIIEGLGSAQRDPDARAALHESQSLRAFLSGEHDHIEALKSSEGLATETLEQLDLIDNIFATIGSHQDVQDSLKPSLQELQIPLAKLALLENDFFVDPSHAGRLFIDRLSRLSSSANFPNKRLEKEIECLVNTIVEEYDTDSAVFSDAVQHIDQLESRQEQALSRNIQRVVDSQQGQEKFRLARESVEHHLHRQLGEGEVPEVLFDLLDHGWRDLLVLMRLQQGAESEALSRHLNILGELNQQLQELRNHPELMPEEPDSKVESTVAYLENEISSALPTQVEHNHHLTNLRDMLYGKLAIQLCQHVHRLNPTAIEPEQLQGRLDNLPRLRRWIKRATELELGSELSYRDGQGVARFMKLAWKNESGDRYLFVNDRGQKFAEFNTVQLARHLSHGASPPAPTDELNIVDQSLFETLEETQRTLSFSRNHDSLTSLINRETFTVQLERALKQAQRKQSSHVLLYVDVDKFSLVNEIYDRENGDQVLLEFAQLLAQLHSSKTSSARLEGDHFAVLLLDRDLDQALQVADRIRSDIETTSIAIEGDEISFTVSIGAAPILEFSTDADVVLDSARQAMRSAKHEGGNKVVAFEENLTSDPRYQEGKSRARQDLERAITGKRFALRAQPIFRTSTLEDSEVEPLYEMLLGLKNDDGTISSPAEFIESAEQYGFMNVVDRWVIHEAFNWIHELADRQKKVPHVSINLSSTSLVEDRFLDYILEQISEFGVGTSRICFEITETGAITNFAKAADFVRTLRKIGCRFAIDDFGTGLASHDYLRDLPVDYVKIDGSFVNQIDQNRENYAMVQSINNLAHFLGRKTIAEWVENEDVLKCLRSISVDYLQGWQVGEPRPLGELTEELANIET